MTDLQWIGSEFVTAGKVRPFCEGVTVTLLVRSDIPRRRRGTMERGEEGRRPLAAGVNKKSRPFEVRPFVISLYESAFMPAS